MKGKINTWKNMPVGIGHEVKEQFNSVWGPPLSQQKPGVMEDEAALQEVTMEDMVEVMQIMEVMEEATQIMEHLEGTIEAI